LIQRAAAEGERDVSRNGTTDAGQATADSDASARFAELAELRLMNKEFLAAEDEVTLLEEGMRTYGLTLAQARGVLAKAADDQDVALARELEKGVEQWVRTAGGRGKRLGRRQFDQMVATYENGAQGEMTRDEVKKRVKALMERNDVEPRRAGLLRSRRWYSKI
jgi:hypothetical protein